MGIYSRMNRLSGHAELRVTGAAPDEFLTACAQSGLPVLGAAREGDFTRRVSLPAKSLPRARRLAQRCCCTAETVSVGGLPAWKRVLVRRCVPLLVCLALLAGLVWSKLYLWEITVSGNETVPTAVILDALRECGVETGSFWPAFTNDQIRSALLLELPELAWATVNVYGSRAEVIVRERVAKPEIYDPDAPTDLIAAKTGFVTRLQVLRGAAAVRQGSAVISGEMLISGAVGSQFSGTYLVHAVGRAEAETFYELTAVTPAQTVQKVYSGGKKVRWALIVGKNRLNFYRNSSICGATCDKLITEYPVGISGLFSLPVCLVRETQREYVRTPRSTDGAAVQRQMATELSASLRAAIGADGAVESEHWTAAQTDGVCTLCLRAHCREQIAVEAPMPPEQIQKIKEEKQ